MIPLQGHGDLPISPFNPSITLKNVLHAPKLIKNFIFVRKFTRDNKVSAEFNPFGFSVKKLARGISSCGLIALVIFILSNRHMDLLSHHHDLWRFLLYFLVFGLLV